MTETTTRHVPARQPKTPRQPASPGYRLRGRQGEVIAAMGRLIVQGHYAVGSLLPREQQLMAEFGLSRPTLREALKVVAAKGLLEMIQKTGTRVRPRSDWNIFDADVLMWHGREGLDERQLRDLVELRQIIEPSAARLAATRASIGALGHIQETLRHMEEAAGDMAAYSEADVAFHLAIISATGNEMLERMSHILSAFLRLSFLIQQDTFERGENTVEEDLAIHRRIVEAIANGNGAAAELAMANVVTNGKMSLAQSLSRRANTGL
jgi:GntR family transcriptional regulator, galactonate operon transcriptional repressor